MRLARRGQSPLGRNRTHTSAWQPYTEWKLNPREHRIWIRCRTDVSSLRTAAHPALQIDLDSAYQLFLNGKLIGSSSNPAGKDLSSTMPLGLTSGITVNRQVTHRGSGFTWTSSRLFFHMVSNACAASEITSLGSRFYGQLPKQ
jgi:hypothetical protein